MGEQQKIKFLEARVKQLEEELARIKKKYKSLEDVYYSTVTYYNVSKIKSGKKDAHFNS